ncbi:alpha/beta hydrolase [Aliiglaciecola sp. LCG003]|uniref:alpha/beta fold hydrolase n=1 Tax=Aliiglaciecola sp. LCG003 TaxID=3053655 RepID=UPI002573DBC6|nr:alpha/beta hydrolase [Aliiglaciecola sp. LCG003]WJG08166.1 alpha/beta hydrolase [Aliiglaciecola sp. LCG003]
MHELRIASLDGTELAVISNGKTDLPPIIFVHGTCSSYKIWHQQFNDSKLNEHFHLIAFDLRGHGHSEKPKVAEFYTEGERWAGDLFSIFEYFNLRKVFIVAWSYGGRVVNDYLKVFGKSMLSGINFIAAGTLATESVKGPGYAVLSALYDESQTVRENAEKRFVTDLTQNVADDYIANQMLNDLSAVPLNVRIFMRNRRMDYEDVLAKLDLPVLLTHGKKDLYSLPLLAELLEVHLPKASTSWYKNDGHIPFLSSPNRFNNELAKFVLTV